MRDLGLTSRLADPSERIFVAVMTVITAMSFGGGCSKDGRKAPPRLRAPVVEKDPVSTGKGTDSGSGRAHELPPLPPEIPSDFTLPDGVTLGSISDGGHLLPPGMRVPKGQPQVPPGVATPLQIAELKKLEKLKVNVDVAAAGLKQCEADCKKTAQSLEKMRVTAEQNRQALEVRYPKFKECLAGQSPFEMSVPFKPRISVKKPKEGTLPSVAEMKRLRRDLHKAHSKCIKFRNKLQELDSNARAQLFTRSRMLEELEEDNEKVHRYLNRWYAAFAAADAPKAKGCKDRLEALSAKYKRCGAVEQYNEVLQSVKKPGVRGALMQGYASCKHGARARGMAQYDQAQTRGADERMVRFLKSKCGQQTEPRSCD